MSANAWIAVYVIVAGLVFSYRASEKGSFQEAFACGILWPLGLGYILFRWAKASF